MSAQPIDSGLDLYVVHAGDLPDACITASELLARIATFGPRTPADEARAQVHVETRGGEATFTLSEGPRILVRRHFAELPRPCDDRRDTLALAILVANENRVAAASGVAESGDNRAITVVNVTGAIALELDSRARSDDAADARGAGAQADEARELEAEEPSGRPAPLSSTDQDHTTREASTRATLKAQGRQDQAHTELGEPAREVEAKLPVDSAASAQNGAGSSHKLRAGLRYLWRVLPIDSVQAAAGIELAIGLRTSVQLSAVGGLPSQTHVQNGRLRLLLVSGEGLGCFSLAQLGPLAAQACGGVAAGGLLVAGEGFDRNGAVTLLWLAGLTRIHLDFAAVSRLRLRLHADGYMNVLRNAIQVVGATQGLTAGRTGVAFGLELSVVL